MQRFKKALALFGVVTLLTTGAVMAPVAHAGSYPSEKGCSKLESPTLEQEGWCLAINRRKGNCLGCHTMIVNPWPDGFPPGGNLAPPLVAMKERFPETWKLRGQIYDATAVNPASRMPPFGKHKVLTEDEIDAIVAFLLTI
jgi:L-cysteine S-thiosulfotransferase